MIEFKDPRIAREVILNRIVQGYESRDDALKWFSLQTLTEKVDALRSLARMIIQSRATSSDVAEAIEMSGLKPSFTPCVQLLNGTLNAQLSKLIQLPEGEHEKSFRLLVALQEIADNRRRAICGDSCNHWWHGDLDSESYLNEVKERYESGNL